MTRFGHAMLEHWGFEPGILYLNHGTVGATPRRVLEVQQRIRDDIARHPSRFLLREVSGQNAGWRPAVTRLRAAAAEVAVFVGARGEDLVFVDNATAGVHSVLHSLRLEPGDEILLTDLGYGSIPNVAAFAARVRGATVRTVTMPYPPRSPEAMVEAIAGAIGPRTRIAVVDHVCSESALVLPIAEIAAACRARGVPVLADGAHAPGALWLDIPSLGVTWYTGNLHKWAWAPWSSAFLWAAPEYQTELHPPVISWGFGQGFAAEFDWVGTRDPSAWLASPAAITFMREVGLDAIRAWNHDLVWRAAHMLAERWGTTFEVPEQMVGCMATVPMPERFGTTKEEVVRLRDALLHEDGIEVQMHAWRGRPWTRLSAQIYNESGDFERLAAAVEARVRPGAL